MTFFFSIPRAQLLQVKKLWILDAYVCNGIKPYILKFKIKVECFSSLLLSHLNDEHIWVNGWWAPALFVWIIAHKIYQLVCQKMEFHIIFTYVYFTCTLKWPRSRLRLLVSYFHTSTFPYGGSVVKPQENGQTHIRQYFFQKKGGDGRSIYNRDNMCYRLLVWLQERDPKTVQ